MSTDDDPSTSPEASGQELDAPPDQPVPVPPAPTPSPPPAGRRSTTSLRVLAWIVLAAGIVLIAAGVATWFVVKDQLSDEKIVVSQDAEHFAGDDVDGPLTAYSEADTIRKHALEASGGKTYAELDQDDPTRETVMTASFLRASLFTSVVSFGVAAFAAGVGVLMILIAVALLRICRLLAPVDVVATT
jgi:hypothetical protein